MAFLRRPEAYGPSVADVATIATHASVVFLAGDRAYKMKRAVRYPYLDYSTLARRGRACEREVALNRRTAPELYLGTAAVVRSPDGALALARDGDAAAGAPVEWLVAMRRFDQAGLLDRLAAAGALTREVAETLAERVAGFHALAAPVTSGRHGGGRAGLAWVVEDNREALDGAPDLFPPSSVQAFGDAADAALARLGPLLDRRLADGFVRDCHGDLHLANVCLVDGAPVIFDGIEFNDRVSRIDVLYDLAFLLMDLVHRDLPAQANAVLNRYLGHTEDHAGLAALPLFLSQRAAVRAKVRAAAADLAAADDERAGHERAARAYFDAALGFLQPAAPLLVAVGGFSGSGKSSLARALAPVLGPAPGAVHLSSDVTRKALFGRAPQDRLPEDAYAPAVNEAVYAAMRETAGTCLAAGHAVVCDAVHARDDERAALADLACQHGARFAGFWLDAPAAALARRITARAGDASDATVAVLEDQVARGAGTVTWTRLDATAPPDAAAAAALDALGLEV